VQLREARLVAISDLGVVPYKRKQRDLAAALLVHLVLVPPIAE
jgi:hypothetical protein